MDLLDLDSLFSEAELAARARIRGFVEAELQPHVEGWFERAEFPRHLPRALGELGVLGMHIEGYGCAGRSAVEYGLACMEIEACDSGLRTFVSVQGSLAMTAIYRSGARRRRSRSGCRAWPPGRRSAASRSPRRKRGATRRRCGRTPVVTAATGS